MVGRSESEAKVSIVIPACNAGKTLCRCIDSCLAQTYGNFEVVCVDDGSTDETGAVLDGYARTAPCGSITVVHQSNSGVVSARNTGIAAAKGEWISFLDADDWLMPDALSDLSAIVDDCVDVVVGDHYVVSNGSRAHRVPMPVFGDITGLEYVNRCLEYGHGYIWGKLIRRDLLRDLVLQPGLCLNEDLLINIHTGMRARLVRYCARSVYYYWWDGAGTLSKQVNAKSVGSVMVVNQRMKELLTADVRARFILDSGYVTYTLRNAAQLYALDFVVPEMRFVLNEARRMAFRHPVRFLREAIRRKSCALSFVAQLGGLTLGRAFYKLVARLR